MATDNTLDSRKLARYGLRRGAYDGANRRRFVLFEKAFQNGEYVDFRREFDTKTERDACAVGRLAQLVTGAR